MTASAIEGRPFRIRHLERWFQTRTTASVDIQEKKMKCETGEETYKVVTAEPPIC